MIFYITCTLASRNNIIDNSLIEIVLFFEQKYFQLHEFVMFLQIRYLDSFDHFVFGKYSLFMALHHNLW